MILCFVLPFYIVAYIVTFIDTIRYFHSYHWLLSQLPTVTFIVTLTYFNITFTYFNSTLTHCNRYLCLLSLLPSVSCTKLLHSLPLSLQHDTFKSSIYRVRGYRVKHKLCYLISFDLYIVAGDCGSLGDTGSPWHPYLIRDNLLSLLISYSSTNLLVSFSYSYFNLSALVQ